MNKNTRKIFLIFLFILTIFFLFNLNLKHISAQEPGVNIAIPIRDRYHFTEYSEISDNKTNIEEINLDLQNFERWKITDLMIDFKSIKLYKEVLTIENEYYGDFALFYQNPAQNLLGLSVQLEIIEKTEIYGLYLYCYKSPDTETPICLQINGFDGTIPNNTVYYQQTLNTSTTPNWYYQNFENKLGSALLLEKGNYSVILNATNPELGSPDRYFWYYNDVNPINGQLYISKLDGNSWVDATQNSTLLYKVAQRVNESYFPEEINMSAQLNGDIYKVYNGNEIGEGLLNKTDLALSLMDGTLNIPIINNNSIDLIFNMTYHFKLENIFLSDGELYYINNEESNWKLMPQFLKCLCNYTVEFIYPTNWEITTILRNSQNITNLILNDGTQLFINSSNILNEDDIWEIYAKSEKIEFSANYGPSQLEPLQELRITVNPPLNQGNLTLFLLDPNGFEEFSETKQLSIENSQFTYQFSENPFEGTYTAYIIWQNGTAAGFLTQEYEISIPFTLDPHFLINILILIILSSALIIGSYKGYKNIKKSRMERRQKIFNKYMDILNLQYIIIIDKKTGLNIYEQTFLDENLDGTLISGFLEAMRSFGVELTNTEDQTQTIKMEFKNAKILMSEFKNFRLILIMSDNPSEDFLESINSLSYDIEKYYGQSINQFEGKNIKKFRGIKDLIDKNLSTLLIYPLMIKVNKQVKISIEERKIITKVKKIMDQNGKNYFFVSSLFSQEKEFSFDDAETVLNLIKKDIFYPYENLP